MPTFNNQASILDVLGGTKEYCSDIFVINDGSTDNTLQLLEKAEGIRLISYPVNRGKGYALRTGIKAAAAAGFTHAISIDSDGQHYPYDIPLFIPHIDENPDALVIGSRKLDHANVPGRSTFGNNFSNFWFGVATGLKLPDTQSGYRLYPVHKLAGTKFYTRKYEFEIEVLVRSAWKGLPVFCTPVNVFYPVKEERVSHFRPIKDFSRISVLNFVLITFAIWYFRPYMALRQMRNSFKGKTIKQIAKEAFGNNQLSDWQVASAAGFGVFMGIFPVWGYQLILGFTLAHLLRINKAIFFAAANISLPPMIPAIIYLSYVCGSFAMGKGSWAVQHELSIEASGQALYQYIIGACILACIAGGAAAGLTFIGCKAAKAIKKFRT
jgi:glycosyltransferase involved in cell wall biosynthesis